MVGKNYVLSIGIGKYAESASFPNLANAVQDAVNISTVLCERYKFEEIEPVIIDNKATRKKILKSLNDLSQVTKDDNLVIYFAGHGKENPLFNMGYWIPYDAKEEYGDFIPYSSALDFVRGIKAKHVLLISDCCFAGWLVQQARGRSISQDHDYLESLNSRWVFASGGTDTVSDGTPGKGSPFSSALFEFLSKNQEVSVSAGELFEEVTRITMSKCPQKPEAELVRCENNAGGEMIFRLSQLRGNKPVDPKPKVLFELPPMPELEYYIPRTVTDHEEQPNGISYFFLKERGKSKLAEAIVLQKRIVLLGSAGTGKSVELFQLAQHMQQTGNYIPIYTRFNTYTEDDIKDILPTGWNKINPSSLVLFFDGLDEVQPKFFHTALRKIGTFSKQSPEVRIIISCRTNFYELPSRDFSGTLESYKVYFLDDISLLEIKSYTTDHFGMNGEKFIREVFDAQFTDLIQKPYFLNLLIRQYKDSGNLRAGRSAIMKDALLTYDSVDREHFKTTFKLLSRDEVFSLLEKIAYVMEGMGKNFLTEAEVKKIFSTGINFENLNFLPAFNKKEGNWMFEHNNIQEYLAASVLSRQTFDTLITDIALPAVDNKMKLKATWTNTVAFLINIGNPEIVSELIDWIIQNDIEFIVRFDHESLDKEKRIAILKQILLWYTDKNIWINSNKFSGKELARFGYYAEVVDFLLTQINGIQSTHTARFNAVHLLREFDINDFKAYGDRVRDALLGLLNSENLDVHDIYTVLGAMGTMNITDRDTLELVVKKFGARKNQYIRSGLYKMLHHSDFVNDFAFVFLEGLHLNISDTTQNDRDSVHLMDETFHLKIGLEKITSPGSLISLIDALSSNESRIYIYSDDFKDILRSVVDNATGIYNTKREIYEHMLNLLRNYSLYQNEHITRLLLPFFTSTGTQWQAFRKCLSDTNEKPHIRDECVNLLLDDSILKRFLEGYREGIFSDDDARYLHHLISWQRGQTAEAKVLLEQIEVAVKSVADVLLTVAPVRDWAAWNKMETQRSFDSLFVKEEITSRITDIFTRLDKTTLTMEDLYSMRPSTSQQIEDQPYASAIDLLYELVRGGLSVELVFLKNWISTSEQFEGLRIEKIYNYLHGSYGTELSVNDQQKTFLQQWCKANGSDLRILWFLIHRFNFQLEEQRLLDLTSEYYDYAAESSFEETGTIEMLRNFVPTDKIDARVVKNLQSVDQIDLQWIANAGYALRQNLKQAYPSIVSTLETSPYDQFKLNEVLEFWFKKTKDYDRLSEIITKAVSGVLQWHAVLLLHQSGKKKEFMRSFLNSLLGDEKARMEDRIAAANYLMQDNDIAGFNFIATYILKKAEPSIDFNSYLRNLTYLKDADALPLLMELLKLSKQPAFTEDRFNNLEIKVLDTLFSIGKESEGNFIKVKNAISSFIAIFSGVHNNISYLEYTIIRIEDQLNIERAKENSIEELLSGFNKLVL